MVHKVKIITLTQHKQICLFSITKKTEAKAAGGVTASFAETQKSKSG
jgi:hypothetical protein